MSYFQGITDAELTEEGWSPEQIKELRRVETSTDTKRKASAKKKYHDDLDALNDKGREIYGQLVTGRFPWHPHMAASAARSTQDPVVSSPKFIYHTEPPRKWWQFWK